MTQKVATTLISQEEIKVPTDVLNKKVKDTKLAQITARSKDSRATLKNIQV